MATTPDETKQRIHRVVLTGGPCAGKTTSINRIRSFFEKIGWKVFTVPETATILLSTGILFYELGSHTMQFQENLLKTLLQIEDTINDTVKFHMLDKKQNCIVIYDRGAMDPVAFLNEKDWEALKIKNPSWNEVDLRDNRYDQIIHLITAANGAEHFYTLDNNMTRTENIEVARDVDLRCAKAWVGHPYMHVIDNATDFDTKVNRVLRTVCERISLQFKGTEKPIGFDIRNRKRKFLVRWTQANDSVFPKPFQDFNVVHNYLVSSSPKIQTRIRKRGQDNVWSYMYTVRNTEDPEQTVETRHQIDKREYLMLLATADVNHMTIYKSRRCFQWHNRYFQLDIYEEPCNQACRGLTILSTHCLESTDEGEMHLPDFIDCEREITHDNHFSMFNLSKKQNIKVE